MAACSAEENSALEERLREMRAVVVECQRAVDKARREAHEAIEAAEHHMRKTVDEAVHQERLVWQSRVDEATALIAQVEYYSLVAKSFHLTCNAA